MGVQVSNNEIMEIFKKIDNIKINPSLSEEETNKQIKINHDLIVQKMSFLVYGQARQYIMFPNYEDIIPGHPSSQALVHIILNHSLAVKSYGPFISSMFLLLKNGI